jgi:hypothetical protein
VATTTNQNKISHLLVKIGGCPFKEMQGTPELGQ